MQWMDFWGPDARDFLHRMTTIDVKALEPGQSRAGFFLNAQGKILAYFNLWCLEPTRFGLQYDADWEESILQTIDKFHFSEKFELKAAQTPAGIPEDHESETARIHALHPRSGFEITSDCNPLELGLKVDPKGCYPGQEVIEKIISLGSPARRLVLIQGKGTAPAPGTAVTHNGREIGKITSSTQEGLTFSALSLVGKTAAKVDTVVQIQNMAATITRVSNYA